MSRKLFANRPAPGILTIAGVAVALGFLPLPAGYYLLVRLLLCGLSIYFLSSVARVRDAEKWVLTGLAILYNPVVPVEVGSRLLWSIISVATLIWFWRLARRASIDLW